MLAGLGIESLAPAAKSESGRLRRIALVASLIALLIALAVFVPQADLGAHILAMPTSARLGHDLDRRAAPSHRSAAATTSLDAGRRFRARDRRALPGVASPALQRPGAAGSVSQPAIHRQPVAGFSSGRTCTWPDLIHQPALFRSRKCRRSSQALRPARAGRRGAIPRSRRRQERRDAVAQSVADLGHPDARWLRRRHHADAAARALQFAAAAGRAPSAPSMAAWASGWRCRSLPRRLHPRSLVGCARPTRDTLSPTKFTTFWHDGIAYDTTLAHFWTDVESLELAEESADQARILHSAPPTELKALSNWMSLRGSGSPPATSPNQEEVRELLKRRRQHRGGNAGEQPSPADLLSVAAPTLRARAFEQHQSLSTAAWRARLPRWRRADSAR